MAALPAGKLKKPPGILRRRSGSYKPRRESSKTVRTAKTEAGTRKKAAASFAAGFGASRPPVALPQLYPPSIGGL
jgi:hypothetical protein